MNDMRKFEYDATKHACVTHGQLDELLHLCFQQSMYTFHSGIEDVPIRRWREITARFPVDIPDDLEHFRAEFGLRFTRSVGLQGIRFEGEYYNSGALGEIRNTMGARRSVVFTVDPTDIRQIFVVRPTDGSYLAVPCLKRFPKAMPLFLHQRLRELEQERGRTPVDQSAVDEAKDAIKANIEAIRNKQGNRGKVDALTAQIMAKGGLEDGAPKAKVESAAKSADIYTQPTEALLKAAKALASASRATDSESKPDAEEGA